MELEHLNEMIERMQLVCEAKNEAQLARCLGLSTASVASWRNASRVPYRACFLVMEKTKCRFDWLVNGKGVVLEDDFLNEKTLQESVEIVLENAALFGFIRYMDKDHTEANKRISEYLLKELKKDEE